QERTDEMCGQRPVVCFPAVLLPCVISNTYHIDISRPDTLTATQPVHTACPVLAAAKKSLLRRLRPPLPSSVPPLV
ncbi:hypothetical protein, partial [Paraburkholderia sp. BR14320]|uniref:hypothetical protein n=1 Tax=unclassified Paraburkholderia TaxID=2615204 RepID=UPI0034CF51C9